MLDDVREWLRDNKGAVVTANENGATALHLAASSFRMEVAKLLLEHGAGICICTCVYTIALLTRQSCMCFPPILSSSTCMYLCSTH